MKNYSMALFNKENMADINVDKWSREEHTEYHNML